MGNLKINRKEDVELISAAIQVERFCHLEFLCFTYQTRDKAFEIVGERAKIAKAVRARIDANTNNQGELNLPVMISSGQQSSGTGLSAVQARQFQSTSGARR